MNEIFTFNDVNIFYEKEIQLDKGKYLISLEINCDNHIICDLFYLVDDNNIASKPEILPKLWYNEISTTSIYNIYVDVKNNCFGKLCIIMSNGIKNDIIRIKNLTINSSDINKPINSINKKYDMKRIFNKNIKSILLSFPLTEDLFEEDDVNTMIDLIKTKKLTMGKHVDEFEKMFANFIGMKYAVMVNSGSSANLLALATITNFARKNKIENNMEILIPAVCWSTSAFPIYQMNLKPIYVDVNPQTLNMDLEDMKKKITLNTRAIMVVHILGNSTNMKELINIAKNNNLEIIEDTCESLGSKYDNKYLGTFGSFGTYSFYYSHHMTTIEGGMIVCNDDKDYEILKCLRAHGWIRHLENKNEYINKYPDIDPRYLFINLGYNVRSTDLNAVIGKSQLNKLQRFNENRRYNYNLIKKYLYANKKYDNQIILPIEIENGDIIWFALCIILNEKYEYLYNKYINYLTENNIENRPVVTGNILRQPVIQFLSQQKPESLIGADIIHKRGLYIGIPSVRQINNCECEYLTDKLLDFFMNEYDNVLK